MVETYRDLADLNLGFLIVGGRSLEGFLFLLPPLCHPIVLAQIQISAEIYDGYLECGLCLGRRVLSGVVRPAKDSTSPIPAMISCRLSW